MFDIIAPASAPQISHQFLAGVQHPLAPELIQAVRGHGNRPVGLWRAINQLASARKPNTRDQGRCLCLRFWGAARELVKVGLLFRHDGLIATTADLEQKLADYRSYFNAVRVHQGLGGNTPVEKGGGSARSLAHLVHYGWQSHCHDLVQLPIAA